MQAGVETETSRPRPHPCQTQTTLLHQMVVLQTRNVLDCDQSNYSSRIIFSCTFTLNQIRIGQDERYQRYGHSKLCKTANGRDLDLVQPEVAPFDPPTSKMLP